MKDDIIDLLSKYGSLSFEALRTFLRTTPEELSKVISEMENITIIKFGKNYELIDGKTLISGTIFYKQEEPYITSDNGSYKISDYRNLLLFTGDRYIYSIDTLFNGRKVVNLIKFISHASNYVVCKAGKVKDDGTRFFKVYDENEAIKKYKVRGTQTNVDMGDLCLVLPTYLKENGTFTAKFISIISKYDAVGEDVMALVASSGVSYEFSKEYYDEVSMLPDSVSDAELIGRTDLTDKKIFTIDGSDAKDFDDAVSLDILPNGNYLLGVHIADVAHYVTEGSLIDQEALKRGTSIYLTDRVIPMLDFKLSNGICSLNEGVTRLTISCFMEFNGKGVMLSSQLKPTYIKSAHRMTYEDTNKMLEENDQDLIDKYADIYPILVEMHKLSSLIREKRTNDGAIDFDIPETYVKVDDKGTPLEVSYRIRGVSELIIEDFMLSANKAVAMTLSNLEYPCLYRVHEEPSSDKIKEMSPFLKSLGIRLSASGAGITSGEIQRVLSRIKGEPFSISVSNLILRAMAKARYDSICLGHFGLGLKYYCHFTSPIRRYPDLFVHRVIANLLFDTNNFNDKLNHYNSIVSNLGTLTSNAERKAIELERMVTDMKEAEYMQEFIGAYFDGIISSVTSFGAFVTLENGIEGLCHISSLPEYVIFDAQTQSLVGEVTGEKFSVGDKVKIRVIDADKFTRRIDFMITGHKRGSIKK